MKTKKKTGPTPISKTELAIMMVEDLLIYENRYDYSVDDLTDELSVLYYDRDFLQKYLKLKGGIINYDVNPGENIRT